MAQEDLELLFKTREHNALLNKKLQAIILEAKQDNFYELVGILREAENLTKEIKEKEKKLETYSLCPHANVNKGVYSWHDSHNDYHQDICKDCGKVMIEY